jgi:hypothetical protein
MRAAARISLRIEREHLLLLKGLLLWSVIAFALLAAWHHGLLHQVWAQDRTGISIGITLVFTLAGASGMVELWRLSRALNHLERLETWLEHHGAIGYLRALNGCGPAPAPEGCISAHARNLETKARLGGGLAVDQRLLLESFEAELRRNHGFAWFTADLLLSLGLLGTVIGFILMLVPISGLDAADQSAIKAALGAMSEGMAVALYTTLTGLIGGLVLKVQGRLLDGGVDEMMRRTTRLCEIHVLPAIERRQSHAA